VYLYLEERAAGFNSIAGMPLRAKIADHTMSSSSLLESQLGKAIEESKVPQAVVFAGSRDGTYLSFRLACWKCLQCQVVAVSIDQLC